MASARLVDRELLRRLVAFDSTSRNSNLPLVDFVADYLDRPGVRIERVFSAAGDKANLIARIGPACDGREGLVLSGHTDVVPPGEGWRSDPFTLVETPDTLVARGACDMKGFLAVAINRTAEAADGALRHPLVLVLTYDEEVGTLGARRLADAWPAERPLPARAVIGEPTSLRPVRMHKGHLRLRLTFHGKSAHSGYPHLGVNAIEHAGRAIVALAGLRDELQQERPPTAEHFPEVPFVALNVGQVHGGTAVNVVPDRATLDVGVRLLPGLASDGVVARVRRAVASAVGGASFDLALVSESPPMALDAGADHYRFLLPDAGVESHGEPAGVSFATDAGWLQTMGMACVIWGPGSITVAHQPNEYLPVAEFHRAGDITDNLVRRFCRVAEVA
jgi:acetylornithine deacetylase